MTWELRNVSEFGRNVVELEIGLKVFDYGFSIEFLLFENSKLLKICCL